ncbi:MAG: glycosyltransferase family 8 protein [Cyanobacteria bacterium SIG30]|nr:glycosyltransferase family 8 protein [Cyanobacteria bacterium SIG30]
MTLRIIYMTNQNKIHIAITHNDAYTEHSVTCITSILENSKEDIVFHIIDGALNDFSKERITEVVKKYNSEVEFNKIDNSMFDGYKKSDYYPVQILWTMVLPDIEDLQNLERLIYLDCDMVIHSSLKELWEMPFDDNYILAVEDANGKKYSRRFLDGKSKFFNTGLMVINCKKWREDKISEKAVEQAIKNTGTPLGYDQTVLNQLLINHIKFLNLKWNLQYCPLNVWATYDDNIEYKLAIKEPNIIHYVGDYKPWAQGLGCYNPKQKDYFKYHEMTYYKKDNLENWLKKDKMQFYKGIIAFIKRYPLFFLKKMFWKNLFRFI